MDEFNKICVIGSGSVALFVAWTLEQNKFNRVSIISDRLYQSQRRYKVFIKNTFQSAIYSPSIKSSAELVANVSNVYIVCDSPQKSIEIVSLIEKERPDSKILIISSFSPILGEYSTRIYQNIVYAWPLLSVEIDNNIITSTGFLELELLWRKSETLELRVFYSLFKDRISLNSNENNFAVRTLLTCALYLYILNCTSLLEIKNKTMIVQFCKPWIMEVAKIHEFTTIDFPGFDNHTILEHQLNYVLSNLIEEIFSNPSSRSNLLYLYNNKEKLYRYLLSSVEYVSENALIKLKNDCYISRRSLKFAKDNL